MQWYLEKNGSKFFFKARWYFRLCQLYVAYLLYLPLIADENGQRQY